MDTLKEIIKDYLKEAKLMQVATARKNKPWVATVWYVHDEDMNLYFISRRKRRHSLEIKANPNVAGAIVKPHYKGSGEKVIGLQFEGLAKEATGEQLETARKLYMEKYENAENIPIEKLKDPKFMVTFYVLKPKIIALFDEINFPKDPRQELRIG